MQGLKLQFFDCRSGSSSLFVRLQYQFFVRISDLGASTFSRRSSRLRCRTHCLVRRERVEFGERLHMGWERCVFASRISFQGSIQFLEGRTVQGQRPLSLYSRKDFQQDVVVPAASAAVHGDTFLVGLLLEQRKRMSIQPRQVLAELFLADA